MWPNAGYHDDVWNMKYLKKYKWSDLMEQIQRERAQREAAQKLADSKAQKEAKVFLSGVEKSRVTEGMAKKNAEKMKRREGADDVKDAVPKENAKPSKRRFHFQQNEVVGGSKDGVMADDAKRVLGKIF